MYSIKWAEIEKNRSDRARSLRALADGITTEEAQRKTLSERLDAEGIHHKPIKAEIYAIIKNKEKIIETLDALSIHCKTATSENAALEKTIAKSIVSRAERAPTPKNQAPTPKSEIKSNRSFTPRAVERKVPFVYATPQGRGTSGVKASKPASK